MCAPIYVGAGNRPTGGSVRNEKGDCVGTLHGNVGARSSTRCTIVRFATQTRPHDAQSCVFLHKVKFFPTQREELAGMVRTTNSNTLNPRNFIQ